MVSALSNSMDFSVMSLRGQCEHDMCKLTYACGYKGDQWCEGSMRL